MEFSNRDANLNPSLLRSESGQAIVEYILILVVSVSIILGGIYQLNSAFKSWANAYFGNYVSCLLETGELPAISGTGGDSGVCNQFFEPFSLGKGRPLVSNYTPPETRGAGGPSDSGSREGKAPGSRVGGAAGGGGGGFGGGGRAFQTGSARSGGVKTKVAAKVDSSSTGNTTPTGYGGGYGATNRRLNTDTRHRLDQRFAFQDEQERQTRRQISSSGPPTERAAGKGPRIRLRGQDLKKGPQDAGDSGLTVPDFLRYLLIAAILLALFVVLGGQALQIGKSMEK